MSRLDVRCGCFNQPDAYSCSQRSSKTSLPGGMMGDVEQDVLSAFLAFQLYSILFSIIHLRNV